MSKLLEIKECHWKDEIYLVREDGFIYRMPKEGSRKSKLDERWTPGSVDASTGYCKFGTERAHLKEHRHNKDFIAMLDKYLPDWQLRKKELDDFIALPFMK